MAIERGSESGGGRPGARASVGVWAGVVAVVAVVGVSVAYPLARVGLEVVRGVAGDPSGAADAARVSVWSIASTLGVALGIGALATVLGWAMARVMVSKRHAWIAPVLACPVFVPMYLAYAGLGQARAPGTLIGDLLAQAAGDGHRWAPVFAGKALAIGGLALWAAPVAALVLAADMARRDRSESELARVDRAGVFRRALMSVRAHAGAVACAAGAVAFVMLGSAVPLHLAQFETFSIAVWRELSETGPGEWWRVWVGAWPVLVVAVVGGWFCAGWAARSATRMRAETVVVEAARAGWGSVVVSGAVWALAVAAPMGLFVWSIDSFSRVADFVTLEGGVVATSAWIALATGGAVSVIAGVTACAFAGGRTLASGVVGAAGRALVIAGAVPGVLIGAAFAGLGQDGVWVVIAAHVARFGFVGFGVGCWVSIAEPPERRALRALESRASVRAWAMSCLPWQWGAIAGAGVGAAALSLHEIEAGVLVLPAGVDTLPRYVLGLLHFARTPELGAAAAVTISGGIAMALVASGLIAWSGRARRIREPRGGGRGMR